MMLRWIILLAFATPLVAQPTMFVLRGAVGVADGGTDSLENTGASPFNLTYTVRNDGATDLNLTGVPLVAIAAEDNCTVTVTQEPAPLVPAAGGTATFRLQVSPIAATDFSFEISIANDDTARNPYNFTFEGDPSAPADDEPSAPEDEGCTANRTGAPFALLVLIVVIGLGRVTRRTTRLTQS